MRIVSFRETEAGNLIFYTSGNEPTSTPVTPIEELPAGTRLRPLEECKVRFSWFDPLGLSKKGREGLAKIGIKTLGQLVAAGSGTVLTDIARGNSCWNFDNHFSNVIEALREIPVLTDSDYVSPVILELPRSFLSIDPRSEKERKLWDDLDPEDQEQVTASLMETMESVFFDILDNQMSKIAARKVREAEEALRKAREEANKWK